MSEVDWRNAPKDAMCFNGGKFWSVSLTRCKYAYWCDSSNKWIYIDGMMTKEQDYEANPMLLEKSRRLASYIEDIAGREF